MRDQKFTFLCDENERDLLSALADHMRRSQGDTIRFLLHNAAQEIGLNTEKPIQTFQQLEGEDL
jgi:hypothetical protein